MQIIEVTDFGVRSAVLKLSRPGTPLRFTVYPMVHMAEPAFFAAVSTGLRRADVIVVEGIHGGDRSVLLNALTASYRVLRFNRRARLVDQDLDLSGHPGEILHPDVDAATFARGWRRMPVRRRLMLWLALPAVVAVRLVGGSRMIWQRMDLQDLPAPAQEETTAWAEETFGGERHDRLLAVLRRLHEERGAEPIEVAVVYGAGHVAAVVQGLRRFGYQPRSGEWLTVAATWRSCDNFFTSLGGSRGG